jgi:hypothetical protein
MPRRSSAASPDQEARNLVDRLGGRWSANGGLCRCPAHADRRPSLSIRPGRTRLLLHCWKMAENWRARQDSNLRPQA